MIAILIGTRPELIKMAPVLRRLDERGLDYIFIHSGQHYSDEMDKKVFEDLKLRTPDYNLEVGSGTHAVQTGKIMEKIETICLDRKPQIMVVHGDTNTALAGALAVKKLHIPIAHVEAGLRSFDYKMPEEINRILIDRISDILFAPTEEAKKNLLKEGIEDRTIVVTGNSVADVLKEHIPLSENSRVFKDFNLEEKKYFLVTAHRPETVDSEERLLKLIDLLKFVIDKTGQDIIWPIHPRTKKQLDLYHINLPDKIIAIPPVGYIDMLKLLNNSSMVLTDSGGIQEEAYILKKPLMTLRDSTERPETLSANFLVDLNLEKVEQALKAYEEGKVSWEENVFGNGEASLIIVEKLISIL